MALVNPEKGRLSRQLAGTRGRAIVVNLPGSTAGAVECLDAILDGRLPIKPIRQCTIVRAPDSNPVEWVQTNGLTHRRYAASSIWAESVWVAEFAA